MTRPRSADDFATIRARMVELRRERERAEASPAVNRDREPVREVARGTASANDAADEAPKRSGNFACIGVHSRPEESN